MNATLPHLAEDGRRIAKLRDDATKTKQKCIKLISEQKRSGKSVALFCRERKLRASHFSWKKRLQENTTGDWWKRGWRSLQPT